MALGSSSFEPVATGRDKASVSGASCHSRSARGSLLSSTYPFGIVNVSVSNLLILRIRGSAKVKFRSCGLRKGLGYTFSTALVRWCYLITARRAVDANLEEYENNRVDVR